MAPNRPAITASTSLHTPGMPVIDVAPFVRMTTDLIAQSSRLWVDLWFRNLSLASTAFWSEVRAAGRD